MKTWLPICGVLFAVLSTGVAAAQGTNGECVVLLHGMGRSSLSMKRMQWALQAAGYKVVNISYPSRRFDVEQLSETYLQDIVTTKVPTDASKVHFVTHSLGGILLRQYLAHHSISKLGRVVMLAPPNHGSLVVDSLRRRAWGRWILGPAGCELGTGTNDLPQRLPPVDFCCGVIAGDVSFNPIFSSVLDSPDDGKVSVKSTEVAGMSDSVVVHSSHTWMMWRGQTLRYVMNFLHQGNFGKVPA
jgi:pimeloyl-ACP methyl ester carboxylesterase